MTYRWRGQALPTAPAAETRRPRPPADPEHAKLVKRIDSQARRRAFNAWREANPEQYEREWSAALIAVHARGGSGMTPSGRHTAAREVIFSMLRREHPELWRHLYGAARAEVAQEPKYRP